MTRHFEKSEQNLAYNLVNLFLFFLPKIKKVCRFKNNIKNIFYFLGRKMNHNEFDVPCWFWLIFFAALASACFLLISI